MTKNEDEYQRGLTDAWEAATKLIEYEYEKAHDVFNVVPVLKNHTPAEAIAKIREYEEVEIGDEVLFHVIKGGVVTTAPAIVMGVTLVQNK